MHNFQITPDEGEAYEVRSTTRDILLWERTTKGAAAHQLQEPTMAALYKIAHLASVRTGRFSGSLKDFEETVDLEVAAEEEPDPTQPEATAAA